MLDKFYIVVNNIIKFINLNNDIHKYLNKCVYNHYENNDKHDTTLSIVACMGGSAFKLYRNIFSKYINHDQIDIDPNLNLNTSDYDVSFSLRQMDDIFFDVVTEDIECRIRDFFYEDIKNYDYSVDQQNMFKFERSMKHSKSKLHLRIQYNKIHIAEFIFWSNNKFSDLFEINIFNKTKLILYEHNNINYYLPSLEILIQSQHHAITDFFERNDLSKCTKYICRASYIKTIYESYSKSEIKNKFMTDIFLLYLQKCRRKINMMTDYPFTLSLCNSRLQDHGFFKCIYKEYRKNHDQKHINMFIDNNLQLCNESEDKRKTGNKNIVSESSPNDDEKMKKISKKKK